MMVPQPHPGKAMAAQEGTRRQPDEAETQRKREAYFLAMQRIAVVKGFRKRLPSDAAVRGVVSAITEPFYAAAGCGGAVAGGAALREALDAAVAEVDAAAADGASPLHGRLLGLRRAKPCDCVNAGRAAVATWRRRSGEGEEAPWVVEALLAARAGPYGGEALAFSLVFDGRWPSAPPKIRCATIATTWLFAGVSLVDETGVGDLNTARRCGTHFYQFLLDAHEAPVAAFDLATTLTTG